MFARAEDWTHELAGWHTVMQARTSNLCDNRGQIARPTNAAALPPKHQGLQRTLHRTQLTDLLPSHGTRSPR